MSRRISGIRSSVFMARAIRTWCDDCRESRQAPATEHRSAGRSAHYTDNLNETKFDAIVFRIGAALRSACPAEGNSMVQASARSALFNRRCREHFFENKKSCAERVASIFAGKSSKFVGKCRGIRSCTARAIFLLSLAQFWACDVSVSFCKNHPWQPCNVCFRA